jgi:methionine-R-sulfoxide reductase
MAGRSTRRNSTSKWPVPRRIHGSSWRTSSTWRGHGTSDECAAGLRITCARPFPCNLIKHERIQSIPRRQVRRRMARTAESGAIPGAASGRHGAYACAGCGVSLFSSREKFDSHCGWPSFYDPANARNVIAREDRSHGAVRTEVLCANCGGHLGHVFAGEGFNTPTDQRYCINGVALKFVPAEPSQKRAGENPSGRGN